MIQKMIATMQIPKMLIRLIVFAALLTSAGAARAEEAAQTAPDGWFSADWPVRYPVAVPEDTPEMQVEIHHYGLAASDGRDLRVIGPDGKPTDFLILHAGLDYAALVFNSSNAAGTCYIYCGNTSSELKPLQSKISRTKGSDWTPKGGYRGIVYGTRGPKGTHELRSYEAVLQNYEAIKKMTIKTEDNPRPIWTREVFYNKLSDNFGEYGLIEAYIYIPQAGSYVFGEGELRMANSLRVLLVDGKLVIPGWFEALSGGILSTQAQGKIHLQKGAHKLTFYAAGQWDLKIAKETDKLEFETIGYDYCYFPEARIVEPGAIEVVPGKKYPDTAVAIASAARKAEQMTRAKTIHLHLIDEFGEQQPALQEASLKELDELEQAAYAINWMTEGKNPARTAATAEEPKFPLTLRQEQRVGWKGNEGLSVAYGTVYMGSPFVLEREPWPLLSPPAIYEGVLYAGSKNCYLYALDLDRQKTKWRFLAGGPVYGGPAVYEQTVFFCSLDGKLYALDRETGRMQWNYPTRDFITTAPAVALGRVYVASYDQNLYCVDAAIGVLRWQFKADGPLAATPVVADGRVFVGSQAGTLYAIDTASGSPIWKSEGHGSVAGAAVADGKVVFTTRDGKIACLAASTGVPQWPAVTIGDQVQAPPVIAGSVAFAANCSKEVKAVDLAAGTVTWEGTFRNGQDVIRPMAFVGGKLYVPAAGLNGGGYNVFFENQEKQ